MKFSKVAFKFHVDYLTRANIHNIDQLSQGRE